MLRIISLTKDAVFLAQFMQEQILPGWVCDVGVHVCVETSRVHSSVPLIWSCALSSWALQVPELHPQDTGRRLPEPGHPAPWSPLGRAAVGLLQWRVSGQGRWLSCCLVAAPLCPLQPGFGQRRGTPGGAASPLCRQQEVCWAQPSLR